MNLKNEQSNSEVTTIAVQMAQLVKHSTMVREVEGSNPGLRQVGISLACTCGSVRDAETQLFVKPLAQILGGTCNNVAGLMSVSVNIVESAMDQTSSSVGRNTHVQLVQMAVWTMMVTMVQLGNYRSSRAHMWQCTELWRDRNHAMRL